MAEFKFTATNSDGAIVSRNVIAENEEEVTLMLKKEKLSLINLTLLKEAKVSIFDKLFNRVNSTDKAQFLEYFASMLEAGLSVDEALQAFYEDLDKPILRKFVKDTQYQVRNGRTLSESFADYPDLFPPLYIGMIKVGESSGTLEKSLRQLAIQIEKSNEIKSKVRNAMIYPAVLVVAIIVVVVILLVVVFPRLEEFFVDTGLELPATTVAFLNASQFTRNYWYLIIAFILIVVFVFRTMMKNPDFKHKMGEFTLKMPIFGNMNRTQNVALFTRILGTLLETGVNILESMDVVKESLGNAAFRNAAEEMKKDLELGNSLADSAKKFPNLFAPFEIRVMSMSERTGEVAKGLTSVAKFYETKLFDLLSGLSSAIEPVMLIIMGLMVAVLALSVITPLYQLLSGIEGL